MKRLLSPALALCTTIACATDRQPAPTAPPATDEPAASDGAATRPAMPVKLTYPEARRADVVDVYHGVEVSDPYRWLEDPDAAATRTWIEAENRLTFGWLERVPARADLRARLQALWDYEKFGVPQREGERLFFTYNPGLLNQSQLLVMDGGEGEPRVLLDPNKLSEDGTVALSSYAPSRDGELLAYATSTAGSDWQEWRVRRVDDGSDLEDHLRWSKFSDASWSPDNEGFYYSAYDPPEDEDETFTGVNFFHKLYYHRLGTPQTDDRLVYARQDHKDWGFDGRVTEDGRYLVIHVWLGTERKNALFYQKLGARPGKVVELLDAFDAHYSFVANQGSVFFLHTDLDAPRGRVIAVDTRRPARARWREVVPQAEEMLAAAQRAGDQLVVEYLKDARSVLRVFDLKGTPVREVELPGLGSVGLLSGRADTDELYYSFEGFTTPPTIYRHDVKSGETTRFRQPKLGFDPAAFETTQVFYQSKDGTRVPMFITHRKGLARDGQRPTFLYGYGGFNISITPRFSPSNLVWMERGGVYAVANIRGGDEYGESWHQDGIKLKKQNGFDDFIAAAEWLIANGYTATARLAIGGGSNGGLLVGACITQRPDLFGAGVAAVGVLDMLRYHTWTIGWAWASDYGTVQDAEEFRALYAYSPYHNTKPGTAYPALLLTTADHDDRVVPAHSFKFAAAMQHAQAGAAPILIRIETKAGHGAGKPTDKIIDETADRWAFLTRVLGAE